MLAKDVKIGVMVVRSKGDYVVGRKGPVIEIDETKGRARVDWNEGGGRTWVKFESLELESIPYRIEPGGWDTKKQRSFFPKYIKL